MKNLSTATGGGRVLDAMSGLVEFSDDEESDETGSTAEEEEEIDQHAAVTIIVHDSVCV